MTRDPTQTPPATSDPEAQEAEYVVVVNAEEQYSIWPVGRDVPAGWRVGGKSGTKVDCLAFIGEVWTDMRPLSLRRHMDASRTADE